MLSAGHQEGFSIIELSVALTVVAVLLTLGVPSLSGYIQNARLGSAAKSFYTGLQTARAEAVKRNAEVEFVIGVVHDLGQRRHLERVFAQVALGACE